MKIILGHRRDSGKVGERGDTLDTMLDISSNHPETMDDEQILANSMLFFLAGNRTLMEASAHVNILGNETVVSALSWALIFMAQDPEIQDRAAEEAVNCPSGEGDRLDKSSLDACPYIKCIVQVSIFVA